MPIATLTIAVSRREADRPRLLQVSARDAAGRPLEGLALTVAVDENGTLDAEAALLTREIVTGSHGLAYLQWWEWPRYGPGRDFTSVVTVTWALEMARVVIEDLYE